VLRGPGPSPTATARPAGLLWWSWRMGRKEHDRGGYIGSVAGPWPLTYCTNQILGPAVVELEDGEKSMTEVGT